MNIKNFFKYNQFKTINLIVLLFILITNSCGLKKPEHAGSVEEALAQMEKDKKKTERAARKKRKGVYKHFWNQQTKKVKKSIKQNYKEMVKSERKKRRKLKYHPSNTPNSKL
jgi:flagellar biosynthesis GTPase FlhF